MTSKKWNLESEFEKWHSAREPFPDLRDVWKDCVESIMRSGIVSPSRLEIGTLVPAKEFCVFDEMESENFELKKRVSELEERLEIDGVFEAGEDGETLVFVDEFPAEFPDGIESRDETIRYLEEEVKRLQAGLIEASFQKALILSVAGIEARYDRESLSFVIKEGSSMKFFQRPETASKELARILREKRLAFYPHDVTEKVIESFFLASARSEKETT